MQSSWFGQAGTEPRIIVFHPKLWQPFKNSEWRVCNNQTPRIRTDTSNHFDVISGSHYTSGKSCRNCLLCCFRILFKYSLHASAYSNLFLVYKYLLTLSFTQVSCERAFSKLKIVKTRLRSSLSNELLETFMLMSIEKDLLSEISVDDIIPFLVK